MKRSPFLLFASLFSVAPFVACGSDSSTNATSDAAAADSGGGADGGSQVTSDADPHGDASSDAGQNPTDAGTDAAPPNAASVTVLKFSAPEAGVSVVFQDAGGAVQSTVVTGADGKAVATTVAGGQITVALGGPGARELFTFVGVKPGDALTVNDPASRDVAATVPTLPPGNTGATTALGNFNCYTNSAGGGVVISLTPDCYRGATFPIISATYVGSMGGYYFAYKKDVTPAAGAQTSAGTLGAWAIYGSTFTLNVTNAPTAASPSAYLGQIADNEAFNLGPTNNYTVVAGSGSATFDIATGYPDALQTEATFVNPVGGGYYSGTSYAKRVAAAATTASFDLNGALLPELQTIAADSTSPARPVVSWTSAAALTAADGAIIRLAWSTVFDGGAETNGWTFMVPSSATSLTAPALPAQVAAWAPVATLDPPSVAFYETDQLADYDAFRPAIAYGLTRVPVPGFSALGPTLPANGTMRVTALAAP